MDYGDIFAKNIRRIRLNRGFSQEQLAEDCGLTRNYIGNIERRENSPSLQTMEAIASALGVSLLELLANKT